MPWKENNATNNDIDLATSSGSNGGAFYNELKEFLISKGYMVNDTGEVIIPNLNGYVVNYSLPFKSAQIVIGYFKL